jgi:homospermidine synthase
MNPLLKHTIDQICEIVELTPTQKDLISIKVAESILTAASQTLDNPNVNMNGGDDVDENTLIPIKPIQLGLFKNATSFIGDLSNWDV